MQHNHVPERQGRGKAEGSCEGVPTGHNCLLGHCTCCQGNVRFIDGTSPSSLDGHENPHCE